MKKNDEEDEYTVNFVPVMRIYVSFYNDENDALEIPEMLELTGEKGIAEFIRELVDGGTTNVYFCCFDKVLKVL